MAGFSDIYEYSSGGLIVPKTDKIRENIVNYMYQIFGENLSLEEGTNTRKFVDNLTNLFSDLLKFSVNNVNMINFAYAGGKNLDYLAEFFGIYRLKANRSQVVCNIGLQVEYNKTYTIPAYSRFLTSNNIIIQTTQDIVYHHNHSDMRTHVVAIMEAIEDGPIFIETGKLTPISSALDFIITTDNVSMPQYKTEVEWCGLIGRLSESDIEMKNRISYSRGYGSSTTNAIANAIYKADPTISCVRCVENNTSSQKTIDGAIVPANGILISISNLQIDSEIKNPSIYPYWDIQNFSISKIENIAKAIYESISAGCNMNLSLTNDDNVKSGIYATGVGIGDAGNTGLRAIEIKDGKIIYGWISDGGGLYIYPAKYVVHVKDVYGIYHKVAFYISGVGNRYAIEMSVKLNGYKGDDIQIDIRKLVGPYISSKIGTITKEEITSLISSSISGVFVTDIRFSSENSTNANTISSTPLYQLCPYGLDTWLTVSVQ